MPDYVVQRVADALNSVKKAINGSRVHLFGVTYKRDVNDVRESPALDILELLTRRGAIVSYTDPYVPKLQHAGHTYASVEFESALEAPRDCSVVTTDHSSFDCARIAALPLIVDTRNAIRREAPHVFRL
jgi:UDP-N-acetyl-D-glucosamine dehydrogenase